MSNNVAQNPLILDTANTSTVLITEPFAVTKIIVNGGASAVAGDSVVLKDKLSVIKFDKAIEVSKGNIESTWPDNNPLFMDGLIGHTITHGTVYIYYKGSCPLKTT